MNIINKGLLLTSTLLLSTALSAAPYISGQVGGFTYGNNNIYKNLLDRDHGTDYRTAGRVGLGYQWNLNQHLNLGVEGGFNGYQDLKLSEDDLNVKIRRISVDALGVVNVYATPKFNIFGKAGAAYVKQKLSADYAGYELGSLSHPTVVPKGAVGVGYDINDNLNLNLSLNHEFMKNRDFMPGATAVMVGLQYAFK